MSASIEALLMAANSKTSYIDFKEHDGELYVPPYLLACNYEFDASSSDEDDDSLQTTLEDIGGSISVSNVCDNVEEDDSPRATTSEDMKRVMNRVNYESDGYTSDEEVVHETIRKCVSWIEENYTFMMKHKFTEGDNEEDIEVMLHDIVEERQ